MLLNPNSPRPASPPSQEDRKNRETLAAHRQKIMSDKLKLENALYREIESANGSLNSSRDFNGRGNATDIGGALSMTDGTYSDRLNDGLKNGSSMHMQPLTPIMFEESQQFEQSPTKSEAEVRCDWSETMRDGVGWYGVVRNGTNCEQIVSADCDHRTTPTIRHMIRLHRHLRVSIDLSGHFQRLSLKSGQEGHRLQSSKR